MDLIYKKQLDKISGLDERVKDIEPSLSRQNESSYKDSICQFHQFCETICVLFDKKDMANCSNAIEKFECFLRDLPPNHFEDISDIIQFHIPQILLFFIQKDQEYVVCSNSISLTCTLIYSCRNISNVFCEPIFIASLCSQILNNNNGMRSKFILTIANLLYDCSEEISKNILNILPIIKLSELSLLNSSTKDANLVENSLKFFKNASRYKISTEDANFLLSVANSLMETYPTLCVSIYTNLVSVQNVLDGFRFDLIQNLLLSDDQKAVYICCIFIREFCKRTEPKISFDINRILFIGLMSNYREEVKESAIKAARRLLEADTNLVNLFDVDLALSCFDKCSKNAKYYIGLILCNYTNHITIKNVAHILEGQINIFFIVHVLFEFEAKSISIKAFEALNTLFKLGEKRPILHGRLCELFSAEFPDDTIWRYITVDDDEVEQIGTNFINTYFSVDDE